MVISYKKGLFYITFPVLRIGQRLKTLLENGQIVERRVHT